MKKYFNYKQFIDNPIFMTIIVIFCNVLNFLYVIPLYKIFDNYKTSALFGFGYTLYSLFISLSVLGLPLAISKVSASYQTMGYYNTKKRTFELGKKLALVLGGVSFLIINIFADFIANLILNGDSMAIDLALVFRGVSIAVMIMPLFSVYKGYFEAHRSNNYITMSSAIGKFSKFMVMVFGTYLALRVFKVSSAMAVFIAFMGVFTGTFISYMYLFYIKSKNKKKFEEKPRRVNEPLIDNKTILKSIISYTVVFALLDLFKSLYNTVDMFMVNKLVSKALFGIDDALNVIGILSVWANKFNVLIFSIVSGILAVLIPNFVQSVSKHDDKECCKKINRAYEMLLFITIPITVFISFLSKAIWILFYGDNQFGPSILSYFIFVGLFIGLLTVTISIILVYKDYKTVLISLVVGLLLKISLNSNLVVAFYKMGLPAYYGIITASILGYLSSFVIAIVMLTKKFNINYEDLIKYFIDILCGSMLMIVVLFVLKLIIPVYSNIRILNLLLIFIYIIFGSIVYLIFMNRTGTIKHIFRANIFKKREK